MPGACTVASFVFIPEIDDYYILRHTFVQSTRKVIFSSLLYTSCTLKRWDKLEEMLESAGTYDET